MKPTDVMRTYRKPIEAISRRTVLKASIVGASTVGAIGSAAGSGSTDGDGGVSCDDDEREDEPDSDPDSDIVTQTTDVIGQGPDGDVLSEDGATIHRTPNDILIEFSMPTPEPGAYTYPSGPPEREGEWWTDEAGDLEAFSLWAFTFDFPDDCENDCGSEDLGEPAGGGAYHVAGHAFSGPDLTFNGYVSTETDLYEDDGEPAGVTVERPMDAEVHLAVAPHGAFDPAMMPEILETPTGPGPDVWWIALFDPPA